MKKLLLTTSILLVVFLVIVSIFVEAKNENNEKKQQQQKQASPKKQQQQASKSNSKEVEIKKEKSASPTPVGVDDLEEQQDDSQQQQEQEEEVVVVSTSNNKATASNVITIRGTLQNFTKMIRDPDTGAPRRIFPRDVARLSVNGGQHVFFSDVHGVFALVLPLAPKGSYHSASAIRTNNRVAVYQLDTDWDKFAFPRVVLEVDEFANFRAYIDGVGKVVGSRGRMGQEKETNNKNKKEAATKNKADSRVGYEEEYEVEELDEYKMPPSSDNNENQQPLEIAALGEAEYFVPRQQFKILDLFKNPMILMMGFTAVMVYGMPYLMDQDEMKKQMRDLQNMKGDDGAAAEKKAVKN